MTDTFTGDIYIEAEPDTVFDYFTEPELLVEWMGTHARLEAVEGGIFAVDIYGVIIRGSYVHVDRPRLIEIAWGEAGNEVMPPGSTRLLVRFDVEGSGTRVRLEHSGLDPEEARKHAVGWPHFLERLRVRGSGADPGPDPWATHPPDQSS